MGSTLHLAMRRKQSQNSQLPTLLVSPDSLLVLVSHARYSTSSENYLSLGLEQGKQAAVIERQLGSKAMIQPALCLQGAKVADFQEHEQGHSCTQPHLANRLVVGGSMHSMMEQMWNLNPER